MGNDIRNFPFPPRNFQTHCCHHLYIAPLRYKPLGHFHNTKTMSKRGRDVTFSHYTDIHTLKFTFRSIKHNSLSPIITLQILYLINSFYLHLTIDYLNLSRFHCSRYFYIFQTFPIYYPNNPLDHKDVSMATVKSLLY